MHGIGIKREHSCVGKPKQARITDGTGLLFGFLCHCFSTHGSIFVVSKPIDAFLCTLFAFKVIPRESYQRFEGS
ncbi:hypothetical protein [Salicibibacter halophilus]|uniref:hypothetical protein n=1 Tax=Salicibibacter halophilus TaxID=2502791 RepID=UPI00135CD55C|nr:hypothetical protein [Salicibibacter halophilus]